MRGKMHDDTHKVQRLISRRLLFRGAAAIVGGLTALVSMGLPALAKMAQLNVGYVISPKDKGDASCATCGLFRPPSSCLMVDGEISPTGWCKLYTKKT